MKFTFKLIWICLALTWALVLSAVVSCKKSVQSIVASAAGTEDLQVSMNEAADPNEIVDCDEKTCGQDVEVVSFVPEYDELERLAKNVASPRDQFALTGEEDIDQALGKMRSFDQLATGIDNSPVLAGAVGMTLKAFLYEFIGGDSASREKIVNGLKEVVRAAVPILEKSSIGPEERTKLQRLAGTLASDEFTQSPLAKIIKSRLTGENDLEFADQLKFSADALRFFDNNISGSTLARKLEVIERLMDLGQDIAKTADGQTNSVYDKTKAKTILTAAMQFAGSDGFINRGDINRLTSIFQRLVARIADQKIAEGYAQGIATLRSDRPFVYRRWVRRPNGLIGRAVNRGIAEKLSAAHSDKMKAIAQATQQSSMLFESAMRSLGVQRYYIGNDRRGMYVDPGPDLTLQTIESVIVAVTGKGSRQLAEGGGSGITTSIPSDLQKLLNRVVLPDGVFVSEGLRLTDGAKILPHGLLFSNADNGKIAIRAYRDVCVCEPAPDKKQCAVSFTDVSRGNSRMKYAFAMKHAPGCEISGCDAAFIDNRKDVYLPYACAYRYEHTESKTLRFFKN